MTRRRKQPPPRVPRRPTGEEIRRAHAEHVANIVDHEGSEEFIFDPKTADNQKIVGGYTPLRIKYDTPDDLLEIIPQAEDSVEATIGNDDDEDDAA